MAQDVLFKKGSAAQYNQLANKVDTTFYYTLADDTNVAALYLGTMKLSNAADVQAALVRVSTNETNISSLSAQLATLVGDDKDKSVATIVANAISPILGGDLSTLTTESKTLIGAINEVASEAAAAQSTADTAKSTADSATSAASGAMAKALSVETSTNNLATLVGTGYAEGQTVKEYIDSKFSGSGYDDTEVRQLIAANTSNISTNSTNISAAQGLINKLIGSDTGKSVREIAADELAEQLIPDNAKESLNTLQEIAAWIQSHPDDASAMNTAITNLQNLIGTIPTSVKEGDTEATPDYDTIVEMIQSLVSTEETRAAGVENALDTRVDALEDAIGSGTGSISTQIETAKSSAISTSEKYTDACLTWGTIG